MTPIYQGRLTPDELSRIETDIFGHLGRTPERYQPEDRYREVGPARGGNSEDSQGEKGQFWSVGQRLERESFGQVRGELSNGLLSKVYGLLAFSLVFAAVGVLVGYRLEAGWSILFFVTQIGLIFAINANREEEGLNLALLYSFCFLTGVTLGPLFASYVNLGMRDVIFQALTATALMTVGMSVIGLNVKQDLSAWWSILFSGLLGLIGLHVLNLFFGQPENVVLLSFLGVLLFSFYIVFDVNRIRYLDDTTGNAVLVCLDLYLDIVNLFVNLLQILAALGGDD